MKQYEKDGKLNFDDCRSISVDGLEVIGRGFFGRVYRIDDDTIVKVYSGSDSIPMIENEKKMARKAFISGIPTAISFDIVKVGEDYGTVFERIDAKTFHEIALDGSIPLPELMDRYTSLIKSVHDIKVDPQTFPSFRQRFIGYLEFIREYTGDDRYDKLKKLFDDMEEEDGFLHGDIQMKNVMLSGDEALLIDMDTIGRGNPVFEFAALYVTYQEFEEDEPGNSQDFLGMSQEMVDNIWERIVDGSFDFKDDDDRRVTLSRIALVAAVRFLYLVVSTDLKNSDLGRLRISHTIEHMDELLCTVKSLSI